jgi:hemerythrin
MLEKYDISDKENHIKAHGDILEFLSKVENFEIQPMISAFLISDCVILYFLEHFPVYDKKFIRELYKIKNKNC